MIEKEKLEQEFFRFGNHSRSKQQIEKKREVERALDEKLQLIQQLKSRLREAKAQLKH